jgi:hypothetical protein
MRIVLLPLQHTYSFPNADLESVEHQFTAYDREASLILVDVRFRNTAHDNLLVDADVKGVLVILERFFDLVKVFALVTEKQVEKYFFMYFHRESKQQRCGGRSSDRCTSLDLRGELQPDDVGGQLHREKRRGEQHQGERRELFGSGCSDARHGEDGRSGRSGRSGVLVSVGLVVLVVLSEQVWRDEFKDSSGRAFRCLVFLGPRRIPPWPGRNSHKVVLPMTCHLLETCDFSIRPKT